MLRLVLTSVLMVLASLPHGVCFCHFFDSEPAQEETVCCEAIATTATRQTDEPGEDDADCACKLREVPALSPTPAASDLDAHTFEAILENTGTAFARTSPAYYQSRSGLLEATSEYVPLTLRALLI